jgi:quercetin dioxygenase-like cupin family protein
MKNMDTFSYEQRASNVFFQNELFKTRIIELKQGQKMPECRMDCFVIFHVIEGEVQISKNDETVTLTINQVLITEPALLSMQTSTGAKILGIQIRER